MLLDIRLTHSTQSTVSMQAPFWGHKFKPPPLGVVVDFYAFGYSNKKPMVQQQKVTIFLNNLDCSAEGKLDFAISSIESHAKGYIKRWSLTNFVLGFMIEKDRYTEKYGGKWLQFKNIHVNGSAYAGLIGNAAGFAKYLQALLKNSVLISDEYKSRLFTRQKKNDGKETEMCLSWFAGNLNGDPYFAHAGGGGGYYCEIRIYPGRNCASVIMFNRTGMKDERFLDKVDKFLLEDLLNLKGNNFLAK